MYVPKGYTKGQVINLIQNVVRSLAYHFTFAYYDVDDLMQEGFIFATEALPRFNPHNRFNCSLENFIRIHVRNRFINLQRDKYFRQKVPCLKCKYYKQNIDLGEMVCGFSGGESCCKKWLAWIKRNTRKRDLAEAYEYEDREYVEENQFENLSNNEIYEYVDRKIPLDVRSDYLRFIEGYKLPKQRREYVRSIILKILEDSPYDKDWL